MREIYVGYTKKTNEELIDIWKNSHITFDTNVLLNLYRYSESTKNSLIDLIKKIEDRVFLTHQVGLEFNRNKYEIIAAQENAHKHFLIDLKKT